MLTGFYTFIKVGIYIIQLILYVCWGAGNPCGVVANVLDCDMVVNEFDFQSLLLHSLSNGYLWEIYERLYCRQGRLNSIISVLFQGWV